MYVFAIVVLLFIFYILHLHFFTFYFQLGNGKKYIFEPYLHCQYVFHHLDLGLKLWFERTVHSVLVSSNIHRMEDLTVTWVIECQFSARNFFVICQLFFLDFLSSLSGITIVILSI